MIIMKIRKKSINYQSAAQIMSPFSNSLWFMMLFGTILLLSFYLVISFGVISLKFLLSLKSWGGLPSWLVSIVIFLIKFVRPVCF